MSTLLERLDSIYKKKLSVKPNNIESFKSKKKKKKRKKKKKKRGETAKKGEKQKKGGKKTFLEKLGFRPVTLQSLKTIKGWSNLCKLLFFFIPALILFLASKIVNIDILRSKQYDPKDDAKYQKYKKNDRNWIYYSGIEFCQIFVAAYIASALYTNIYIEPQSSIESYLTTSYEYLNIFFLDYVFIFLLFLPKGFHFLIYDVIFKAEGTTTAKETEKEEEIDLKNLPILTDFVLKGGATAIHEKSDLSFRYLLFYLIAFGICTFFLKSIATLFLDMFRFKANPAMYIFILFGFITWAIGVATKMNINVKITEKDSVSLPNPKILYMGTITYIIYLFLHVIISLFLAPIAQGTFSLYLFLFLSGGVNFFTNTFGNIFTYSESHISKQLRENVMLKDTKVAETFWDKLMSFISTFDYFLYFYIFRNNELMFTFMLMIFFFYKILVTFIPPFHLQIFGLKIFFGIVNIMAFMGFTYLYYLLIKPSKT